VGEAFSKELSSVGGKLQVGKMGLYTPSEFAKSRCITTKLPRLNENASGRRYGTDDFLLTQEECIVESVAFLRNKTMARSMAALRKNSNVRVCPLIEETQCSNPHTF
jgi:hypothetical protein